MDTALELRRQGGGPYGANLGRRHANYAALSPPQLHAALEGAVRAHCVPVGAAPARTTNR